MSGTFHEASGKESLEPLNVPHLAAGTLMIQSTGTEVLLILQSARPLADKNTGAISERTATHPIAVVSISPGTAKDLYILLGNAVAMFEKSFGPITTPFTVKRVGEKSSLVPCGYPAREASTPSVHDQERKPTADNLVTPPVSSARSRRRR